MSKLINLSNLTRFWSGVKTYIDTALNGKVSTEAGKGLSTNDLTNALKANYDSAYDHSQTTHAPASAQANVIEGVSVNGVAQTPANKVVNITVPTTVASLSDAGNYALKTDISTVYRYCGSVAAYENLPTSATTGDVYNVEGDDGQNYAWNGTAWDSLGGHIEVEVATNSEIDALFA